MQLRESFGPGDVTTLAVVPGGSFVLDEIRDFSSSSHFDQQPVRVLGSSLPVGWATGAGSYAGTIVCQQFERAALWKLRRYAGAAQMMDQDPEAARNASKADLDFWTRSVQLQQLPPFHLYFVHHSESGAMGLARLYGVKISSVGEVKGQGQRRTEETMQYQALFYEQLELHRSLSPGEITEITGKSQSFFGGYRADPGQLATDTLAVAGRGSLQDYVEEEVRQLESREARGELTTIEAARRGDFVWGRGSSSSGPEEEGSGRISRSGSEVDLDVTARSGQVDISEVFPAEGASTVKTEAALYVRSGRLFIEDGPAREDWQPAPSAPGLGLVSESGQVTLGGPEYIGALFDRSGLFQDSLLFSPERVELSILFSGEGGIRDVTRQARSGLVTERLEADVSARIGPYENEGALDESYEITEGPVLSGQIAGESFETPFEGARADVRLSVDGSLETRVQLEMGSDGTNYYVKRRAVAGRPDAVFTGPGDAASFSGDVLGYPATLSGGPGNWAGMVLESPVTGAKTDLGGGFSLVLQDGGDAALVSVVDGGRKIG